MRVFVSHAGRDRAWAEWVAWHLRAAGYAVEIDLDWRQGDSFLARMRQALQECDVMVALYSPAYFVEGAYTLMELDAWLARPQRNDGLVPLRVAECDVPHLYRPYLWADLFGLSDEAAREVLLRAVPARPAGPDVRPPASGEDTGPRVPGGALPAVWSVPTRNPDFVGRDDLLIALRERLTAGSRAVVQALHGWGGVGKTSVAIEYAHRFAGEYDLAWWIDAEKPELIGDQVATLAVAASVAPEGTATPVAVARIKDLLRRRSRWLLIFDNAVRPDDLREWLPGGTGHVIVTSRHRSWAGVAASVEIDVFSRAESIALLRAQTGMSEPEADELAAALGDLPLALAQAAGFLTSTGMPVHLYLTMLSDHARRALDQGRAVGYPSSLAGSISLSRQRLAETDAVALAMIQVCALLAPEPVPVEWFLDPPPAQRVPALRDVDAARLFAAAGVLGELGLARPGPEGLLLHRLTQAVIADTLSESERDEVAAAARALVVAVRPDDGENPRHWPTWQALLPHAASSATTTPTRWPARPPWPPPCGPSATTRPSAPSWNRRWPPTAASSATIIPTLFDASSTWSPPCAITATSPPPTPWRPSSPTPAPGALRRPDPSASRFLQTARHGEAWSHQDGSRRRRLPRRWIGRRRLASS